MKFLYLGLESLDFFEEFDKKRDFTQNNNSKTLNGSLLTQILENKFFFDYHDKFQREVNYSILASFSEKDFQRNYSKLILLMRKPSQHERQTETEMYLIKPLDKKNNQKYNFKNLIVVYMLLIEMKLHFLIFIF